MSDPRRVILDTNCLVYAVQQKLDIVDHLMETFIGSEISIEVPTGVLTELANLVSASEKDSKNAGIALAMLKKRIEFGDVSQVKSEGNVDAWMVQEGRKDKNIVVCTYDARLKKYLKELGVQILSPRGHKRS